MKSGIAGIAPLVAAAALLAPPSANAQAARHEFSAAAHTQPQMAQRDEPEVVSCELLDNGTPAPAPRVEYRLDITLTVGPLPATQQTNVR